MELRKTSLGLAGAQGGREWTGVMVRVLQEIEGDHRLSEALFYKILTTNLQTNLLLMFKCLWIII